MQEEGTIAVDLRIPSEGVTLRNFRVTPLDGDRYRVMEVPVAFAAEEIGFRDVVELKPAVDGVYELKTVVEHAGWRRFDCGVPAALVESSFLGDVLTRVEEEGGDWVRYWGGLVAIVLPPGSTWDPLEDLRGHEAPEDRQESQRPAEATPRWWRRLGFWKRLRR